MERIKASFAAAGKDFNNLTVDDLAPIDEFHTRGRESTIELATMACLTASHEVLDVGCGLGGTARHLAHQYDCRVTGIDITEEYVSVGEKLTELVCLHDRVLHQQGSALDLPYADGSFDVVCTEHAQMNIQDKKRFYCEIARVLKPGGRFLFHDIFRGTGDAPIYPAPWAEDESLSALATVSEARSLIEQAALEVTEWNSKVQESIEFFKVVSERMKADGPPPIGIHLLMGDNAKDKLQNYVRNMSEGRVSVGLGMARKI
jgi:ubiquinone/menaquinone biosynthesis C-methylase UbiE